VLYVRSPEGEVDSWERVGDVGPTDTESPAGRQNYDYYQTWNAAVSDLTSQGPPTTASSTAPIVTVSIPLLSRVTQPARIFAP
jgi:hypothetical protein